MSREKDLEAVVKILKDTEAEGLCEGLTVGLMAAQRIFVWYSMNHALVIPYSPEKLTEWSIEQLDDLKNRIKSSKVSSKS